jgi:hypothetical protein
MSMNIKQELDKIASFIPVGESVREVARAALAEIERLEEELADCRRELESEQSGRIGGGG